MHDTGFLALGNLVNVFFAFLQGIIVARILQPDLYGVVVLIMAVPNLVLTFFDSHTNDAIIRYIRQGAEKNDSGLVLAVCRFGYIVDLSTACIAFLFVYLGLPWIVDSIIKQPEYAWLVILYASALLPRALRTTSKAILVSQSRFRLISLLSIFLSVIRMASVVGLVLLGYGAVGVIVGNIIFFCVSGFLFLIVTQRVLHERWHARWWLGSWKPMIGLWKEIFTFVGLTNLTGLVGLFAKQGDVIILGYFRDSSAVGSYNVARSLSRLLLTVSKSLEAVTYTTLSTLYASGNLNRLRQIVSKRALKVGLPCAALIVLFLVPSAPYLIEWALGDSYLVATQVVQVLFLSQCAFVAFFWLRPLYLAAGKPGKWTLFTSYGSVFALVAYPLGAYYYGMIGIAIAVLLSILLVFVTGLAGLRKLPIWD